jgi:DNA-directed RNA polymerase subunit beta'
MLNLKKTAFKNNYSHPISTLNNNGTSNQKNNFIDSLKYNLSNLKQTVLILKNTDAFSLMLRVTENTKKLSKQKAVWGELEIFSVLRFHKLYIQYLVNKICLIYRYALYNNKTLTFSFYSIFLSKFSKNKIHFFYFLKASQKQLVYYLYTSLIKDFLKIHTKTVFYDIITFTLQSYKQQFSLISSVQSVVSNNTPSSPGVKIGLQYIKLQRPFFLAYQKSKPALTAKSFYSSRIYNYMLISHTFWKLYQKDKFAKVPLNEYLTWRANNQFKIVGLSTPFLEQNQKQDLVFSTPFISGKKLSNNIYCISHRELWEQEKDWQDFAYFYYSPTVLTDLIIPSYENRSYESLFNFDRTLISLNNDVSENGININTSFSGAGLIQKLLNDMGSLSELKKIDKQNRILLFEYNKHLKKLKQKKKNPKVGKISYHKACNIRDLLIRRTKLTRKIQRSVNEMNINSNSFLMSDSQVTLNESKSSSSNIFNVGTANVSLKNSGLSGVTIGSLNQQALPLPLRTSGYSTSGYTINKNNTVQNTVLSSTNSFAGNMILTILPVLPPVLRPVLKMSGQFTISDLNRLYQRIIYRNERLKKFLKDPALSSSFEMKYAQRLLQEAVDNLIQNGKSGVVPEKDARGRLLKSLSDILKGKQGRFRQYLLGKRVDYSARSVIVVGPRLKLHECGIPKEMAVVLYSPFLIKRILNEKLADTYLSAKKLLKTKPLLVSQLLREIMKVCPVLLNRAPTLHRLGFQAFQPKLVDGKAILLHPLVCPAFNADFDGDQMAVHIPITFEARAEAWKLMLARNNIKSPATGEPLMLPSQDMVLGCYYLTTNCAEKNMKYKTGSGMSFTNLTDVLKLYNQNLIHVHAVIWVNLTNSSLVHKPLNLNSTVTQGTKGPSGVKVLQGNNKTKREYFIEKSILPELQIANITAAEQPFEIRIPLLKCSVTGGTKADPSILQGKARKNQLQIKNITNFDTGFIPIGNYLEILKHIHHIIKISKTNQIIYKIIKTTPGKILFNIIIKNAIEKKPKLLWKHVYQTGSLRKQITTTIDSHIHNTVT